MSPTSKVEHHPKKKSLVPAEQRRPDIVDARRRFARSLRRWDPGRLVFIDETGVNMSLVRARGRAARGTRVFDYVPTNVWRNYTLISALRCDGIIAPFVFPGALNTQALRVWVSDVLIPDLQPGDIVVWDNLSVHKDALVQEALREKGVALRYTPAYSPDLNPIEMAWSKAKSILRRLRAQSWDSLIEAISEALEAITSEDCLGWFKHVGCRVEDPSFRKQL